jgi:hypothetical protein
MKAISLIQPWASLVVVGAKQIETRSWRTQHRGRVAVHASKKWDKGLGDIANSEPFLSALGHAWEVMNTQGEVLRSTTPLGKIIGTVDIVDCGIIEEEPGGKVMIRYERDGNGLRFPLEHEGELAFGDYRPGRYAWMLANPCILAQAIPYRGALGLWELPDEMLANAAFLTPAA